MSREKCCYNCCHCDFEDYYNEDEDDWFSYYSCSLNREEFDEDDGCCDEYC